MAIIKLNSNSLASGVGGKVLQVVSATKDDAQSTTDASTFNDVSGMSVNITPSSTSNKIFILVHLALGINTTSGNRIHCQVTDDSNNVIHSTDTPGNRTEVFTSTLLGATATMQTEVFSILLSPSSTSQQTYKVRYTGTGTGVATKVNATGNDTNSSTYTRAVSTITAMEISG